MKLKRVEVECFRGLVKSKFELDDLTVFSGEMGVGKTSKLLAILYCLTGSAPQGMNLDDMINIDSDHMWVKIEGEHNGQKFIFERSKRTGRPSSFKINIDNLPKVNENIFIDGRDIFRFFLGAPTEKALKIDTLLGLSKFSQVSSEINTNHIERRINDLKNRLEEIAQLTILTEKIRITQSELKQVEEEISIVSNNLYENSEKYSIAEYVKIKADEHYKKNIEIQSKKRLITSIEEQIQSINVDSNRVEETVNELNSKHSASQKRVAFLEAVMQILEIDERKINDVSTCPICGALISPDALDRFRHYDEEYRILIGEITEVEVEIASKRESFEEAVRNKEKKEILTNQLNKLKLELSNVTLEVIQQEDVKNAEDLLNKRNKLKQRALELEIRRNSLKDNLETYRSLHGSLQQITVEEVNIRITNLEKLMIRLSRIKSALVESINEIRTNQISNLKSSFKETFKKIYPYDRLTGVDFENVLVRGKEIIQVKGELGDKWIHPHQMSTGENVAISFALLFAVNQLDNTPIFLLDEPEEGLDENGIKGLVDILKQLKKSTQLLIATRSSMLENSLTS
ncbi:MAG TPA: AAA family ATPase [Nitrososphaerales archaeon]